MTDASFYFWLFKFFIRLDLRNCRLYDTIRYDTIQYIYVRSKADEMASFI